MTAPTRELPFYCPLLSGTRSDSKELGDRCVAWASRFGLVDGEEQRRLSRIDIGLLTSMVMPNAFEAAAQLAADFSAWLFAFDDLYADEQKNLPTAELAALVSRLARVLEAVADTPDEHALGYPFVIALRDVRIRLAALATSTQVTRWVEAMRAYFMATLWEATNRAHGLTPDLNSYTMLRIHSGAMRPSIVLLDVADGYEISTATMMRPDVQALMEMTCTLGGWDNDIVSYHKESARVGDGQNLLDIILRSENCTAAEALSRAVVMRDRIMSRFLLLREQILRESDPNLARYAISLGYWVRGNIEWGKQSSRYASVDGLTGPGATEWATHPVTDNAEPLPVGTIAWWWTL